MTCQSADALIRAPQRGMMTAIVIFLNHAAPRIPPTSFPVKSLSKLLRPRFLQTAQDATSASYPLLHPHLSPTWDTDSVHHLLPAAVPMAFQPDWESVQPQHKWQILVRQKRFAIWALFTSIGSVMFGTRAQSQGRKCHH